MNYSADSLDLFEFHDAAFRFLSRDKDILRLEASMLNIHKRTEQNPGDIDMETDRALISFRGLRNAVCELYTKNHPAPPVVYTDDKALDMIVSQLHADMWVQYYEKLPEALHEFGGRSSGPYFCMRFGFDSVTVEWNSYCGKAWYERSKLIQRPIWLNTPSGPETLVVQLRSQEGERGAMSCSASLLYNKKYYHGFGTDPEWQDSLSNLQSHLPEGVSIEHIDD